MVEPAKTSIQFSIKTWGNLSLTYARLRAESRRKVEFLVWNWQDLSWKRSWLYLGTRTQFIFGKIGEGRHGTEASRTAARDGNAWQRKRRERVGTPAHDAKSGTG